MKVEKCPVCEGRGTMPAGFYSGIQGGDACAREMCRSCSGLGVLYISEPLDVYTPPVSPPPTYPFWPDVWITSSGPDYFSKQLHSFGGN